MTQLQALHYRQEQLYFENIALENIAKRFGTPTYVYSKAVLLDNFLRYKNACANRLAQICYAVKANSNIAILHLLAQHGAGFDIVSGGELLRVIAAGGDARKVIFSGVGKSKQEMRLALEHNIFCFNVESVAELYRLNDVAKAMNQQAPISLRINPDINANTHPYISTGLKNNKFGIAFSEAKQAYLAARELPHLKIVGIDCHIGSQLLDDTPLLEALDKLLGLIDELSHENISIHHLDLGGGIGIRYRDENPIAIDVYLKRVFERIDRWQAKRSSHNLQLVFEPGRSIVGEAGVLLTQVEFIKPAQDKSFAIVDAAMNDLIRPAMYDAWMPVTEVQKKANLSSHTYDIVGPVCESGDWLAKQRELKIEAGDLLIIGAAGAYGMTMASNYNTRARAAEVLVDGDQVHLIRQREELSDLFAGELIPQNL